MDEDNPEIEENGESSEESEQTPEEIEPTESPVEEAAETPAEETAETPAEENDATDVEKELMAEATAPVKMPDSVEIMKMIKQADEYVKDMEESEAIPLYEKALAYAKQANRSLLIHQIESKLKLIQ